jgi:hypothetical protein
MDSVSGETREPATLLEKIRRNLPRLRTRAYILAFLIILPFIYVFSYRHFSSTPAKPLPASAPNYTPQQIIDDLNARLAYLHSRTSNVGFYIHTVRMRENMWKLATKMHYSVHSIIGCNPQLETYEINYKQKLLIPSKSGTLHIVQDSDSWEKIAQRYKVSIDELNKFNPGGVNIAKGDMVFIPDRRPDMEIMNDKMRQKYEMRALFVSPLGGRLTSTFGMRWHPVTGQRSLHGGIDIAVKEGTWVGAAADGIVTVASDDAGHYGKAVFIDHQDGYVTHYGHLSSIRVRVGQHVKARQLIAKSGSTGRSTGPHLHFTIQKNGVNKDPLKFIW